MKFFWCSPVGLAMIQRLQAEGNTVRWNTDSPAGTGIVEKTTAFDPRMDEIIILALPVKTGLITEKLRADGYKVLGSSAFMDAMNIPEYSKQIMELHGVDDIPVQIEGCFNGEEWIHHSFSTTVEEEYFMPGDLGMRIPGMGLTSFFYRHARPRHAKDTLLKLTQTLKKVGHVGPVGIRNGRIHGGSLDLCTLLLDQELGKTFSDLAKGTVRSWHVKYDFAMGVSMTVPPFPFAIDVMREGMKVKMPKELWAHMASAEVSLEQETGDIVSVTSVIGMMSAVEPTIHEARRKVYERIRQIEVPNLQYRIDVGEKAMREVPQILREVSSHGDGSSIVRDSGERSLAVHVVASDVGEC